MIITRLMGGLANQMFQYAYGLYLAKVNNTQLFIDTSLIECRSTKREHAVFRDFDLDIFDLDFNYPSKKVLFDYGCIDDTYIKNIIRKFKFIFHKPNLEIQIGHNFSTYQLNTPDNSCVIGRWQSDKYFEGINVKDIFKFKNPLLVENKLIEEKINYSNSVSIHFRRGDYVTNKYYADKIGALDIEFYNKAIFEILKKVENPTFFIFSDDIEWVKNNLPNTDGSYNFIEQDKNKRGMKEDLHLMSLCENHIISNSTFAWWGAYLAQGDNVIAPKKWANDLNFIPPHIHPENWIVL